MGFLKSLFKRDKKEKFVLSREFLDSIRETSRRCRVIDPLRDYARPMYHEVSSYKPK